MKFLYFIFISYLKFNLWNGIEIYLKEERGYPLVSFMVIILSGSAYENPEELGLTHFLEHMLFDGTKNYKREKLNEEFSNSGIYVNAFTREDYTAFFFTGPSKEIEKGIYLLSEMLFESNFPDEEFEKEKNVVIEEMNMERKREENIHEEEAMKYLFAGLPYSNPVIGYEETIKNLKKENLINFWKKHYIPQNMKIIAVGNFEIERILEMIKIYFGKYPPGERIYLEMNKIEYKEKEFFKKRGDFTKNYITIGFNAPLLNENFSEYFMILNKILNSERIKEKIKNKFEGVEEIHFDYVARKGASILKFYAVYENDLTDKIFNEIDKVIKELILDIKEKDFEGAKNSLIYEKIYNEENYTYALIFKSYYIPFGGPPFEEKIYERIKRAKFKDFKNFFKNYDFEKRRGFASLKWKEKGYGESNIYKIERKFVGGTKVLFKYEQDSKIFAMNILIKNRNMIERKGASEILSRILYKKLSQLEEIGARIKTYDDPYLPFDDYYHRRDFIYIRLEIPKENALKGIKVLKENLKNLDFKENEIKSIKEELISILKREEKNPSYVSEKVLWENLFENKTFSKPLLGNEKEIEGLSLNELKEVYNNFLSEGNLIIGVVSPFTFEEIKEYLNIFKTNSLNFPPEYIEIKGKGFIKKININSRETYIRIARIIPSIKNEENPALKLLSLIISKRMQEIIREKMGASYRLGASVSDYENFSLFEIGIGTSPNKWKDVIEKVFEIIEDLKKNPPGAEEIEKILSSFYGRNLRFHQSRINQAYFMSFYELVGAGYEYDLNIFEILKSVDYNKLPYLIEKYLKKEELGIVIAGKMEEE